MERNDPDRTIAVLTAIVQTMMAKQYGDASDDGAKAFERAVNDDDPLALAISATLSPEERAHAFAWSDDRLRCADDEMRAIPVVPYLNAQQRGRVRTMLFASDAADEAHAIAVGPPEPPRQDSAGALEIGAASFVDMMRRDALAQRADVPELGADASVDERIAALPEPWRSRTRRELETLTDRITRTLDRDGAAAQPS